MLFWSIKLQMTFRNGHSIGVGTEDGIEWQLPEANN